MGTFVDVYSSGNWVNGLILEHPKSAKEHTGWAMAGIGADFVGFVQPVAEAGAKKFGNERVAAATATPIIQKALIAMMVMGNTCGFGEPDKGGHFSNGAVKFNEASNALKSSTTPPSSWEGESSDRYGQRNDEHQGRAARMAEIDEAVKSALENEATQNDVTRKMLDRCQTVLGLSIVPAVVARAIPPAGPAIATGIEIAAVAATLPLAIDRYLDLIENSARNATLIRRAGAGYDQIAAASHI
ncbi:EspA/EspE family type VII secretion system effector [Mycolicibacterium nivoides]|uniref:EspA/EspE family type VII secretion system effector n=1 Tax=Mycolicibacterium nivoides TaxID=2487344 RepID=A0ABW9L8J2_9MYCO